MSLRRGVYAHRPSAHAGPSQWLGRAAALLSALCLAMLAATCSAADTWVASNPCPLAQDLTDIWGCSESCIFAVGRNGAVVRYDGVTWYLTDTGTTTTLYGVWGSSPADVFAVGYGGTILHFDGIGWTRTDCGTTLNGVWGSASDDVFAVGKSGAIVHYDGSHWEEVASPVSSDLISVWGIDSATVYATSELGEVIRFDGQRWELVYPGTSGKCLLGSLWGTAGDDIFAVGLGGVVVHFDGYRWRELRQGQFSEPEFLCVAGTSGCDFWVAGSGGVIRHFDGFGWQEVEVESLGPAWFEATAAIRGLLSTQVDHLYAVGEGGIRELRRQPVLTETEAAPTLREIWTHVFEKETGVLLEAAIFAHEWEDGSISVLGRDGWYALLDADGDLLRWAHPAAGLSSAAAASNGEILCLGRLTDEPAPFALLKIDRAGDVRPVKDFAGEDAPSGALPLYAPSLGGNCLIAWMRDGAWWVGELLASGETLWESDINALSALRQSSALGSAASRSCLRTVTSLSTDKDGYVFICGQCYVGDGVTDFITALDPERQSVWYSEATPDNGVRGVGPRVLGVRADGVVLTVRGNVGRYCSTEQKASPQETCGDLLIEGYDRLTGDPAFLNPASLSAPLGDCGIKDWAYDTAELSGGGYVLAGHGSRAFVALISAAGEPLWIRYLAAEGGVDGFFISLSPTAAGGFLAAGRIYPNWDTVRGGQAFVLVSTRDGVFEMPRLLEGLGRTLRWSRL